MNDLVIRAALYVLGAVATLFIVLVALLISDTVSWPLRQTLRRILQRNADLSSYLRNLLWKWFLQIDGIIATIGLLLSVFGGYAFEWH